MTLDNESDRSSSGRADSPGREPVTQAVPIVKCAPDGTIDENIFCLSCGYNLRGLLGDPVRCPECGGDNRLGDIIVPATFITNALKQLEATPTDCVTAVLMIVALIAVSIAADWPLRILWLGLAVGAGVRWIVKYRSFADTVSDRSSAKSVIAQFHLITLLCVAGIAIVSLPLNSRAFGWPAPPKALQYGSFFGSALLIGIGLLLYRRMQVKRRLLQRETAVRIARDMLRKKLTTAR